MGTRKRRILDINPELVKTLPGECTECCYWESKRAAKPGGIFKRGVKRSWVSSMLDKDFSPGKTLQIEGETIGYIQFAPPAAFPRLAETLYPLPSGDSVYVSCLYVVPDLRGKGLGRLLIESVARDLYRRRFKALETHGISVPGEAPPGPAEFFFACGFRVTRDHGEAPLMRLDLKSLIPGRDSVQSLLEKIPLQSLSGRPMPRPEPPCT